MKNTLLTLMTQNTEMNYIEFFGLRVAHLLYMNSVVFGAPYQKSPAILTIVYIRLINHHSLNGDFNHENFNLFIRTEN